MSEESGNDLKKKYLQATGRVTGDLKNYYPRAVLLFGSMASWLEGKSNKIPNDMDLLIVANNRPFELENRDYGIEIEFNLMRIDQMVDIAHSLKYDNKTVVFSKLYSKNVVKQHCIDVTAACLLLGSSYKEFGIEQIEVDGLPDKRDYSIHRVLLGSLWWERLRDYACDRRGPWKRLSDKLVGLDRFE